MIRIAVLFIVSILLSACTTTRSIGSREFMVNSATRYGSDEDPREQGFLKVDNKPAVCTGNGNKLRGGYFSRPRPPEKGETETAYRVYLEHERKRVQACAVAALYCSTKSLLSPQDFFARGHGSCRVDFDSPRKVGAGYESSELGGYICATREPEYVSALHEQSYTTHGWIVGYDKWRTLCERRHSQTECENILKPARQDDLPNQNPYPKWTVESLLTVPPMVGEEGGMLWAETEVDLAPACHLIERRH